MTLVTIVENVLQAYRLEKDDEKKDGLIALSESFMEEAHPQVAQRIYRMIQEAKGETNPKMEVG